MSKVSIVILNYNGKTFLEKFLPTLIKCSSPHEIVVADNGSTDESHQLIETQFPEVRLLLLKENLGFPGGYNRALKQIEADYYVILNSDVEVTENWLEPLIFFLDHNPDYAAVQPKIRDYKKKSHFEYAGAAGGFIDLLGYPYCRGRVFDALEEDLGQYDSTIDIFWATGACMLIRSSDFHEIGGFDASFFAHMEEIDLCWRLGNQGRAIACIPESIVYHVGGGTLSSANPRKTYLNFRNSLQLLLKNLPLNELWKIPVRMILDFPAALKIGSESGIRHFFMILKAQIDFLLWVPGTLSRRQVQKSRIRSINRRSVVWDYFIKNKKTYRELLQ